MAAPRLAFFRKVIIPSLDGDLQLRTLLGIALFLALGALPTTAQEELVGSWEGLIGGTPSMRTVLHLTLDTEGRLGGTVDSPEQNAFGLGVSEATFEQGAFSFRVPVSNGAWEGRLDQAGGKLIGIWKQRGAELERVPIEHRRHERRAEVP